MKAWHSYLDWEMSEAALETQDGVAEDQEGAGVSRGSHKRVLVLFERCLIACALYEEFWTKVRGEDDDRGVCAEKHHYTITLTDGMKTVRHI